MGLILMDDGRKSQGSHGLGLWKAIMQGFKDFIKEISFKFGDGGES